MPLSIDDLPKGFSDDEGCSLHVNISLSPSDVAAWFAAFKPVYDRCVAEEECTFFAVYQDAENPGEISWVEHWTKSPKWMLEVQIPKDYYHPFFEITEPMFVKPRVARWVKRVEGLTVVKDEKGRR